MRFWDLVAHEWDKNFYIYRYDRRDTFLMPFKTEKPLLFRTSVLN